jgi:hypothetical protein
LRNTAAIATTEPQLQSTVCPRQRRRCPTVSVATRSTGRIILCKLGSYDLALGALAKAVDGGYTVTEPLLHDPWLAPLRDNPRFTEILRRAQAGRDEALAVFRAEGGEALLGLGSAA